MPSTETFRIPTHRQHVPTARNYVRKALADWGITDELAERATLSANELVTNAVSRVSDARVRVALVLCRCELVLEVSDPDRDRLPVPRRPGLEEEGGRGLALVEALTDSWGTRQGSYTKTVWARFTLPPSETPVLGRP
jgi:anti-sigma regulatory factor (Ser/Thr protein kinase)